MSRFVRGDVILVSLRIAGAGPEKVRPALVVGAEGERLLVIPVSCTPSRDTPSVPLSLPDFSEGGLDIVRESFLLPAHAAWVFQRSVIGKKGRVTQEFLSRVAEDM
ncbi:MAG: type II toxin-antitoxin system PemK/MazF family toxin [Methanolinea sp.]|nr:type II toxin-antitoxin system PemK/MazF family toxin [Methanolinea sp.]